MEYFEHLCQTIKYEEKYKNQKDPREFYHVREKIQNETVKKWAEDAMKEREAFWQSMKIESTLE